jgi:hypothetical protein
MMAVASVYQATSVAAVEANTESALRQAPRRMVLWRLAMFDRLLQEMEEVRVSGDHTLPEDLRRRISVFSAWQDPELAQEVGAAGPRELDRIHNALFDAQGRVMTELSELRGTPTWQEVEQLFNEPADPEFLEAA